MIKFFKDIYSFYKLKLNESNYKVGFFCLNNFIFEYLEPYIFNKSKKNEVLIKAFGEKIVTSYLKLKEQELKDFNSEETFSKKSITF